MTILRNVKLMIMGDGHVQPTHARAVPGYNQRNAIVQIVGVPQDVTVEEVALAYGRCVITPLMHADQPIAWSKIAGAEQGKIIHLKTGRPPAPAGEKSQRINITLSPAAIAILDARGAGRSQEIERLIFASASTPFAG